MTHHPGHSDRLQAGIRRALPLLLVVLGCAHRPALRPPEPPALPNPFVTLERAGERAPLSGILAEARAGDWILRNERLTVVVGAGDAGRRGRILDAAPIGGEDRLRAVTTVLGSDPSRPVVYDRLVEAPGDSVTRVLVARGRDGFNAGPAVETFFRLRAGWDRLEIDTRWIASGDSTAGRGAIGDLVEWGRTTPFAPGPGGNLPNTLPSLPWIGAAGGGTAYLYAPAEGRLKGSQGEDGARLWGRRETVGNGDTLRYVRELVVSPGSVADAADRWLRRHGRASGEVLVHVEDRARVPLSGAKVSLVDEAGRPVRRAVTGSEGTVWMSVPAGRYRIEVFQPERGRVQSGAFSVSLGATAVRTLRLPPPSHLTLESLDEAGRPIAATWMVEGIDGTSDPDFGPAYSFPKAGSVLFSPDGRLTAAIPAGDYAVRAARGPGWEAWNRRIRVEAGGGTTLHATLTPLPGLAEWVALDPAVHALPETTSLVGRADRLRAAACRGLQWVVLGAKRGDRSGLVATSTRKPPGRTLAVGIDGMEIWNGRRPEEFDRRWEEWMTALRSGRRVLGLGGSGSRTLLDGGVPRTLVARFGDADSSRAFADGNVIVTSGPLIEFTLEGGGVGSTITPSAETVRGHLTVTSPRDIEVKHVEIYVSGVLQDIYMINNLFDQPCFDEDVSIRMKRTGFVVVRVTGVGIDRVATLSRGTPSYRREPYSVLAFSNPIWVDIPEGRR